jgi:pimeloyl-ACP methyl ester carboxylesterase
MSKPIDYVFLHGGVQGGWVWDETIAALDRQTGDHHGRTLALDVPGCGAKRGRDADGLGPDDVAAELIADIEAAGLSEALLVGHSQAGTVLPRMVALRPKLFRRVVYVSCIAPLPGQTVRNFRDELPDVGDAAARAAWPAGDPRELLRALFCNDMTPDQASAFMAKLGSDAWPERMHDVCDWRYEHLEATPGSYFVCLRDATLPPAWQAVFADRLKACRRVRLDAGHQVMNTRPHALAEALRYEAELA